MVQFVSRVCCIFSICKCSVGLNIVFLLNKVYLVMKKFVLFGLIDLVMWFCACVFLGVWGIVFTVVDVLVTVYVLYRRGYIVRK